MKLQFTHFKMKELAAIIIIALIYYIAARLSLLVAFQNTNASPVWPPSGIAFVAILFLGYRIWPAITIGAFLANVVTLSAHESFAIISTITASSFIAFGNTLEAVMGVFFLRRFVGQRNPLDRPSDVVKFIFIALLTCLANSLIGPTILHAVGIVPSALYSTTWLTWWLGDATGVLLLAPLFFHWSQRPFVFLKPKHFVEIIVFFVILFIISLSICGGKPQLGIVNYSFSYFLIPPIVWAAFRFGQGGVGLAVLMVASLSIWGTINGSGPFIKDTLNDSLLILEIFLGVITSMGMLLAAALTQSQTAEEELRRSKQELSDFFENATVGLHWEGPDGVIQWVNNAELKMLGYQREEYIGHNIADFHIDPEKIRDILNRLTRGEEVDNYEAELKCKNGSIRHVLINSNVFWEDGKFIHTRCFTRDITERKLIEQILSEREKWFRTLIENSTDIITLVDAQGIVLYTSPSTVKILGYTLKEYIGRNILEFVHPDDLPFITQRLDEVRQEPGNFVSAECRFRHKDNSWRWLEGSGKNLLREESIRAIVINCRDITERKEAQQQVKKSEERFHGIYNSSKDAIAYVNLDGILVDVNDAFIKMTGYFRGELLTGKKFQDLTPGEYHDFEEKKIEEVLRTGKPIEYEKEYLRKDGSRVPVLLTVFAVKGVDGHVTGLAALMRDIAEQKKAYEERFRLAAIVDSSSDSITGKTLDGIITSWNQGAQRLYGYSAQEMIGKSVALLIPADRPHELQQIFSRLKQGERVEFETVRRRKGEKLIDVSLAISPIKDAAGKIIGASTIARDITERKRAEQHLQEALKMKSEFTSTVSHELRTPLAITKEAVSLLIREKVGKITEKQKEVISIANSNIDRLGILINDILDFSKIEAGKMELHKEWIDVVALVKECREEWKLEADAKNIQLEFTAPEKEIRLFVDKMRLLQILFNLIHNAIKFTPTQGRVDICIAEKEDECQFAVKDTGPGIAKKDFAKLFQKFQQLKRSYGPGAQGTGLGLSIIKSLVELHGGQVSVESDLGQGATFLFTIPKIKNNHSKKENAAYVK